MADKQLQAEVSALLKLLPQLPSPWDVDQFCQSLAHQRGRQLTIHAMDIPALPFGVWVADDAEDHIVHRVGLTGFHRAHTILHEVCHMLAEHNRAIDPAHKAPEQSDEEWLSILIQQSLANPCTARQEEMAELFATAVLKQCQHTARTRSDFECRAASMFGAD